MPLGEAQRRLKTLQFDIDYLDQKSIGIRSKADRLRIKAAGLQRRIDELVARQGQGELGSEARP
jgi:hypothetical protein